MYEVVCEQYEKIFPISNAMCGLVQRYLNCNSVVLDIGCATGELLYKNSALMKIGIGIDPDVSLIARAGIIHRRPNLSFLRGDMNTLESSFKTMNDEVVSEFDLVTITGNTLVHLQSPHGLRFFLDRLKKILKNGSRILIQILNYDRILAEKPQMLPDIRSENYIFERTYNYRDKLIDFHIRLLDRDHNRISESVTTIYPLIYDEIIEMLSLAGFTTDTVMGDLNDRPFIKDKSELLILSSSYIGY